MSARSDALYLRNSSLSALEAARRDLAAGTGSQERVQTAQDELTSRQRTLDIEREYDSITSREMRGRAWTGGEPGEVADRYRQAEQNVIGRSAEHSPWSPADQGQDRADAAHDDDADGWFSSGADAAHRDWLDSMGHVDADVDVDVQ